MDSTSKCSLVLRSSFLTRADLFMLINGAFFLLMCYFFYFDRYVLFHGKGTIHEFFLYALAIFAVILALWAKFRLFEFNFIILLLIELPILIHFAGGFIEVDGARLYEFRFGNIRYDKFVHLINSLLTSIVLIHLFIRNNYKITTLISATIIFTVLGLGAVFEILEFVVALTVEDNGVGTYRNNMLDLVANLIGSTAGVALFHLVLRKTVWK